MREPLQPGHWAQKDEETKICALEGRPVLLGDNLVGIFPLHLRFQNWKGAQSFYFSNDGSEVREEQ